MKKIILYFSAIAISLSIFSCKKDTTTETPTIDIATQNSYDDQAIQKFLVDHYLDNKGKVLAYSDVASTNPNLSTLNPVTLPSGVIYIIRTGAQPTSGTAIASDDAISMMHNTMGYYATKDATTGVVSFTASGYLANTIISTGVPEYDPYYFYVKNSIIVAYNKKYSTSVGHSYFEIEGFKEALAHYQSFNMNDSENYNLQGVIIVPSRAAFARDPHFPYQGYNWTDRSFVFNFQIYKTTPRSVAGD